MSLKDMFYPIRVPSAGMGCDVSELYQQASAQHLQNAWAQAQAQQYAQVQQLNSDPSIHVKATHLLKLRLAGLDSKFHISAEEFLTCHVANGTVYIFFVINNKAGHIEEETALFPSDKLITQFRLIR